MAPRHNVLLSLASLLCIILAVFVLVQNWSGSVSVTIGNQTWPSVMLGPVLLSLFVLGALASFFRLWGMASMLRSRIKHDELRREKAEVKAETSSDQIRALESKIQTLEKALEQALGTSTTKKKR